MRRLKNILILLTLFAMSVRESVDVGELMEYMPNLSSCATKQTTQEHVCVFVSGTILRNSYSYKSLHCI